MDGWIDRQIDRQRDNLGGAISFIALNGLVEGKKLQENPIFDNKNHGFL